VHKNEYQAASALFVWDIGFTGVAGGLAADADASAIDVGGLAGVGGLAIGTCPVGDTEALFVVSRKSISMKALVR